MNQEIDYYSKYLKYKNKYINLKIEIEGGELNAKVYCDQVVPTLQMALEILQKAKAKPITKENDIYAIAPKKVFSWGNFKRGKKSIERKGSNINMMFEWCYQRFGGEGNLLKNLKKKSISELATEEKSTYSKDEATKLINEIKKDEIYNKFPFSWKEYVTKLEALL